MSAHLIEDCYEYLPKSPGYLKPIKKPFSAIDILRSIQEEAFLVRFAALTIANGGTLGNLNLLKKAASRIEACYE